MKKQSSWDKLKEKSIYHFNNTIVDKRKDAIINLGYIQADFTKEVKKIVKESSPANWETRGFKGEGAFIPKPDLEEEEYDLTRVGIDPKIIITNLAWKLPKKLQAISDAFGLEDCMERIHVQKPGQLWNLHIDKLYKWCPEDPTRVGRYFIQLTDWEMGQFWQYGTYNWSHWRAGSVTSFDWQNMPHCTANAGFTPRVTLQLTGIITDKTKLFLKELKKAPLVLSQ
jgi:hypothetical protein